MKPLKYIACYLILFTFYLLQVLPAAATTSSAEPTSRTISGDLERVSTAAATVEVLPVTWVSPSDRDTRALAAGDYDGDGDLDLAVGNSENPNQLYLNYGDGTFSVFNLDAQTYDTRALAWGDYDGDGDLDLAVGNNEAINQLYRNDQQGQFTEMPTSQVFGSAENATTGVAWGDYNGDGYLDLVVSNFEQQNQLYRNNGDGSFTEVSNAFTGTMKTTSVAWGDSDGDGDLDLAFGNEFQANQLYVNNGDGTFTEKPAALGVVAKPTQSIAWGDYNEDGLLDLAIGNGCLPSDLCPGTTAIYQSNNENQLYTNTGSNVFAATTLLNPWRRTFSVAWIDYDADGDIDLLSGSVGQQNYVRLNDGQNINLSGNRANDNSFASYAMVVGDFNGDGTVDMAVGNDGPNQIFKNESAPLLGFNLTNTYRRTFSMAWGDYNNDGYLDLALGNYGAVNEIFCNQQGALTPCASNPFTAADNTESIAWGDYDNDGYLDLAVGNNGVNHIYRNIQGTLTLVPNALGTDAIYTKNVAWGDYDNDGDLDLAVGNYQKASVLYEYDQTTDQFIPHQLNSTSPTYMVAWADYDSDGDLDLAMGNFGRVNQIYRNDSTAEVLFTPFNLGTAERNTSSIAWADYDGDGDLDLAVGNFQSNNEIYQNEGFGEFTLIKIDTETRRTRAIAWGDYNGDGWPDLAIGNGDNDFSQLYQNLGDGRFRAMNLLINRSSYPELGETRTLAWADYDRDGDLDLAAGREDSNQLPIGVAPLPQLFENNVQEAQSLNSTVTISLTRPIPAPAAAFYVPPQVISDTVIPIQYAIFQNNGLPLNHIAAEYSLNGGGQWFPAIATSDTITTNFDHEAQQTFYWDTFASGFFGNSDNVTFRLIAYPQTQSGTPAVANSYAYLNTTPFPIQRPFAAATTLPFRVRGTQIEVTQNNQPAEGAVVYHLLGDQNPPAYILGNGEGIPLTTDEKGILSGRPIIKPADQLLAMWPVPTETLKALDIIPFANNYTLYHTSGPPSENGLDFNQVDSPGVVSLNVSAEHPLLVFHLNVSLEWDARNDQLFLLELEQSFKEASALLYDVTNGQVVLGQINLFHSKAYWNQADIVIYANNSLRPSAVIGGIANQLLDDPGSASKDPYPDAYGRGQIRMGTSWDPYGENTADLGVEWTHALAHELAHYLFFLPDNYLGFKGKNDNVLGRVVCPNSFMTSTSDPSYTEFLTLAEWQAFLACQNTLANRTTGRADWETVTAFYPMLYPPTSTLNGPTQLPLAITRVLPWAFTAETPPLTARNFDIRDDSNERLRLPDAQAYLFKTHNPADPSDDVLIPLGNPTGGGDRLKVRGAADGDGLCLYNTTAAHSYYACTEISANKISISPEHYEQAWEPAVNARAITSSTIQVTVTLDIPLETGETLWLQLFPVHYRSAPCVAPLAQMQQTSDDYAQEIALPLPAYEIVARLFVRDTNGQQASNGRDTVTSFRLNWPTAADSVSSEPLPPECTDSSSDALLFSPIVGGEIQGLIYNNDIPVAGPNNVGIGGPNNVGIGGPNNVGIGGPNNVGIGGPNNVGIGGPNNVGIGGPNNVGIGGGSFQAPILSADAQVVIYSTISFFAPNGVNRLQALPAVPQQTTHPWLVPVGQAYHVDLATNESGRFISFTYLQRDVPEGYEHTLTIYFLPDCAAAQPDCKRTWQRIEETQRFVENLIVAPLQTEDGVYAVMATIQGGTLYPGWNLLSYPLPDKRCVGECPFVQAQAGCFGRVLASIEGQYDGLTLAQIDDVKLPAPLTPQVTVAYLEPNMVYWIHIAGEQSITPYYAPPTRQPDGTYLSCTVNLSNFPSSNYLPLVVGRS